MDMGTCSNYHIFWYFNQVDRECVQFYYGGCDGNQNRFNSRHTCEISCKISKKERLALSGLPTVCRKPLDYGGNCADNEPFNVTTKWYYDFMSKNCYSFDYSGCGLNESNRFESNEECSQVCVEALSKNNSSPITTELALSGREENKISNQILGD